VIVAGNSELTTLEDRWTQLRTHKRVLARVKFQVEWEEDRAPRRANAVTVDVSHSGCMAVVPGDLRLHQHVRLIHPESGRKADAQVVWRGHEAWDVGFELLKPDPSFWGVKL
jgi:c-di-GMP-binding flagellar brake protein YcgR